MCRLGRVSPFPVCAFLPSESSDTRAKIYRFIEANAACYFIIDFGRLVPHLGLAGEATELEGEVELMRRIISKGVHIVSTRSSLADEHSSERAEPHVAR